MTFPIRLSLIVTTCATLFIGGCSIQTTDTGRISTPQQDMIQVEQLLTEAETAPPIKSAKLKAEAARILVQLDRKEDAARLLEEIDLSLLSPGLRFEIAELKARAALEREDGSSALRYLQQLPEEQRSTLPSERQYQLSEMEADAYRYQQDNLSEAQKLIQMSSFSPEEKQQALHDRIWQTLNNIPTQQLQQLTRNPGNNYYEQGWYELSLSARSATDLSTQSSQLEQWQVLWQSHPAHNLPPSALQAITNAEQFSARHIALLLPLSGKLQKPAEAIMTGFMTAHYNAVRSGSETSKVTILDSTKLNEPALLYQVAAEKEIDLIIGPLEKTLVRQLLESSVASIPTLTLNTIANLSQSNVYQFGLAVEDEAIQAAERIWSDGHRQVITYTPETDWGQRAMVAFNDHFTELGGTVLANSSYSNDASYSEDIAAILGTDQSNQRRKRITQIIAERVESDDRRRQDVDAIFLSALPQAARQIKPTLSFHYAGKIPVYATSHLYTGSVSEIEDQDLNGIRFVATPWLVQEPTTAHLQLAQLRDNTDSRFGRLYALGIDAFQLYPFLGQLAASPDAKINGETGSLSIPDNNKIQRKLTWSLFRKGSPAPLQ